MGFIDWCKSISGRSVSIDGKKSVINDDKLTARERELATKRNGSGDFILTPGIEDYFTTPALR